MWFVPCSLKPHFVSIKWGNPEASHSTGTAAFLLGVRKRDFQGGLHTTSSISTALFGELRETPASTSSHMRSGSEQSQSLQSVPPRPAQGEGSRPWRRGLAQAHSRPCGFQGRPRCGGPAPCQPRCGSGFCYRTVWVLFEQARIQKGGAFSPSFIGTSNQKHLEIQGAKLDAFRAQLRLCQAQPSLSKLASLRPLSQHPPLQDGFPPACLASSCLSSIIHPSNFLLPLISSQGG